MVQVGDVIVSFDVLREKFCCDLSRCHGACCVEGDAGAPLTLDEVSAIEKLLPDIEDELTPEARKVISEQGICYNDPSGELVTSIVNGKDCVFCVKGEIKNENENENENENRNGCSADNKDGGQGYNVGAKFGSNAAHNTDGPNILKDISICAIERAWREGRVPFMKPVSCHLYPIRVSHYGPYWALNYNRWDICRCAVEKGEREGIPVWRFLREPLIRMFGSEWYDELELVVSELERQKLL